MRSQVSAAHLWVMAVLLLAAFAVVASGSEQAQAAAVYQPAPAATALLTATSEFSSTMAVVPAKTWVVVGDSLAVTVSITVAPPYGFATYELTLRQSGGDGQLFDYVKPPTESTGPPQVDNPFTFVLRAVRPATVVFAAQAYGERGCRYFQWWYINGESAPVQVTDAGPRYYVHLPTLLTGWSTWPQPAR